MQEKHSGIPSSGPPSSRFANAMLEHFNKMDTSKIYESLTNSLNTAKIASSGNIAPSNALMIQHVVDSKDAVIVIRDTSKGALENLRETNDSTNFGKTVFVKEKSAASTSYDKNFPPEILGMIPLDQRLSKKPNDKPVDLEAINSKDTESKSNPYIASPIKNEKGTLYVKITTNSNGELERDFKWSHSKPQPEEGYEEVKVIARQSGNKISYMLADYDLQSVSHKKDTLQQGGVMYSSTSDTSYGILNTDIQLYEKLKSATNGMVQHMQDTLNPNSYDFSMNKDTPFTAFVPKEKVPRIISNIEEYVQFLNEIKEKGYTPDIDLFKGMIIDEEGIVKHDKDLAKAYEAFFKDYMTPKGQIKENADINEHPLIKAVLEKNGVDNFKEGDAIISGLIKEKLRMQGVGNCEIEVTKKTYTDLVKEVVTKSPKQEVVTQTPFARTVRSRSIVRSF
jgi:hypothetical protein